MERVGKSPVDTSVELVESMLICISRWFLSSPFPYLIQSPICSIAEHLPGTVIVMMGMFPQIPNTGDGTYRIQASMARRNMEE